MESKILLFLAFVSGAVFINAALMFAIYRVLGGVTAKLTDAMSLVQNNGATQQKMRALEEASATARDLSETAKHKLAELDPILLEVQGKHRSLLAGVDSKCEKISSELTIRTEQLRNSVANPANAIGSFAAGLVSLLGVIQSKGEK